MGEIKLKIASVVIGSGEGGGSGVEPYYTDLPDKPSINGETLSGEMTSEDLGLASAEQAVPSGGTTGQVLTKRSNLPNDVEWAPSSGIIGANANNLDAGSEATASIDENHILQLGIPVGQNAVNPFKGWFTTDNIPTTGQEGDYCNVSDTSQETPTVTIYRWSTAQNEFVDTGEVPDTANAETFASSEELNQVAIDDSHLVNPVNTADATQPVLAKAEDVMQLKTKLEGVTASEVMGVVTTVNGKYVYAKGEGNPIGSIQSATNSILAIIDITGYDQIRVLMRYVVGTNIASGAAFYDENLNLSTFSNAESSKLYTLPWRTGADEATTEELVLKIPFGAKYFITSLQTSGVYTTQKFYAYLKKGDSLSDVLADLKFTDSLDVSGLQIDKKECSMTSGYVKDNGDIGVGTSSMIATVVLNSEQRVAFLATYKSQNGDMGYAFYDGNLNVIEAHPYPIGDTTLSTEINADIPTNAAYLKFTVYYTIRNNYYCYLLSGNTDAEEANNSIGDISYNEILAAPTIQAGYCVRGTTGEVMHLNETNTSIFNIPDGAKYVRFLGEDKVSTGVTSGYFFYKIEGVDTEIPIGGNTFRQGIVASTAVMEYVVEIPKGATIFKTTSNSIALLQSDFYCYFGFGTNIKDYINSIEHVSLTPILPSMEEFAYYMQRKSENIGMTNSEWHNPYGGRLYGFNYTTVKDLLYMTVFAASNPTLMRLMGSDSVKIQIVGKNEGVRTVTNDMRQQINTQYAALHSGATCPYRIIANKAGAHTNEDGSGVVSIKNGFALVLIAEIEGKLVAAVTGIGNTSLGYTEGRLRRVKGMVELLDICAASIRGESIQGMSVTFCDKAIACILPSYPSTCANYELPLIYQQDANTVFMPASVSKVMAAIAMIDILPLNDYYEILGNPDELVNDSDYTAYAGDIQTVEDSMYAMLMASNGANTLSLARLAGEHLLHNKNIILSNQ